MLLHYVQNAKEIKIEKERKKMVEFILIFPCALFFIMCC